MSVIDELLRNNEEYASTFDKGDLPIPPGKHVAVVTCMDARLSPYVMLGLHEGEAHIIRNAGGVITDDEIRSLVISQRLLGTQEIQDDVGIKPHFALESFSDLDENVRQSIARIKSSPFIPNKENVRGFVYEVETGRLREVSS